MVAIILESKYKIKYFKDLYKNITTIKFKKKHGKFDTQLKMRRRFLCKEKSCSGVMLHSSVKRGFLDREMSQITFESK